jgi:hypothetical protein
MSKLPARNDLPVLVLFTITTAARVPNAYFTLKFKLYVRGHKSKRAAAEPLVFALT